MQRAILRIDFEDRAVRKTRAFHDRRAQRAAAAPVAAVGGKLILAGGHRLELRHRQARRQAPHVDVSEISCERIRHGPGRREMKRRAGGRGGAVRGAARIEFQIRRHIHALGLHALGAIAETLHFRPRKFEVHLHRRAGAGRRGAAERPVELRLSRHVRLPDRPIDDVLEVDVLHVERAFESGGLPAEMAHERAVCVAFRRHDIHVHRERVERAVRVHVDGRLDVDARERLEKSSHFRQRQAIGVQRDIELAARERLGAAGPSECRHERAAVGLHAQIADLGRAFLETQVARKLLDVHVGRSSGELCDVELHAGLVIREAQLGVQARDVFQQAAAVADDHVPVGHIQIFDGKRWRAPPAGVPPGFDEAIEVPAGLIAL